MSVPAAHLHSSHFNTILIFPQGGRIPITIEREISHHVFVPWWWLAVQFVAQNSLSVSLWSALEHCSLCGYCLQIILKSNSMSLQWCILTCNLTIKFEFEIPNPWVCGVIMSFISLDINHERLDMIRHDFWYWHGKSIECHPRKHILQCPYSHVSHNWKTYNHSMAQRNSFLTLNTYSWYIRYLLRWSEICLSISNMFWTNREFWFWQCSNVLMSFVELQKHSAVLNYMKERRNPSIEIKWLFGCDKCMNYRSLVCWGHSYFYFIWFDWKQALH